MSNSADAFERLFETSDDPWAFRTRWYEARKRQLTLACLPAQRYARGYEPGCANGELSAALATRCDALLVSDGAAAAVALARKRLAAFAQVEVRQSLVPADWPEGRFDLIVISEFGYYLSPAELATLAERAKRSLGDDGVLLACHWRAPIAGCDIAGDEVHRVLDAQLGMAQLVHHVEPDFVLNLWSADPRSVATREGT